MKRLLPITATFISIAATATFADGISIFDDPKVIVPKSPLVNFNGIDVTFTKNSHNDDFDGGSSSTPDQNFTLHKVVTVQFSIGSRYGFDVAFGKNDEWLDSDFSSKRRFVSLEPHLEFAKGELGTFFQYGDASYYNFFAGTWPSPHLERAWGITGNYNVNKFKFEGYLGKFSDDSHSRSIYGFGLGYSIVPGVEFELFTRYEAAPNYAPQRLTTAAVNLHLSDMFNESRYSRNLPTLNVGHSRFHGDAAFSSLPTFSFRNSGWEQTTLKLSFAIGKKKVKKSMFNGVRTVDYFYD
jgi:hypothetical protein